MEVQQYNAPNSHIHHSLSLYFANNNGFGNSTFLSNFICDLGQSTICKTDIQHLPRDMSSSKMVDILIDPLQQKWERVDSKSPNQENTI